MFFKQKHGGPQGRALKHDVPALGLRKFDRLEPHPAMIDHRLFDLYTDFDTPVPVLFWRRSRERSARHRCPLMDPSIGITTVSVGIDVLHTLNLGPWQRFCMHALWHFLENNIYDCYGGAEKKRAESILRLRSDLFLHYRSLSEEDRGKITELEDLTVKMLGAPHRKKLKTKAAETKALVPFVIKMCRTHAAHLGPAGRVIDMAGSCLVRFFAILDEQGRVMTRESQKEPIAHRSVSSSRLGPIAPGRERLKVLDHAAKRKNMYTYVVYKELMDLAKRHCRLIRATGWSFTPKHHV